MTKNTKTVLKAIAFASAATLAGVALYVYLDDQAREKVEGAFNRERVKIFIKQKLNGSETLINAVDNMSDSEVNALMDLANEADRLKNKAADGFETLTGKAQDVRNRITDYF